MKSSIWNIISHNLYRIFIRIYNKHSKFANSISYLLSNFFKNVRVTAYIFVSYYMMLCCLLKKHNWKWPRKNIWTIRSDEKISIWSNQVHNTNISLQRNYKINTMWMSAIFQNVQISLCILNSHPSCQANTRPSFPN